MKASVAGRRVEAGGERELLELARAIAAGLRELDRAGRLPAATARELIARVRAHPARATLSPGYLTEAVLGPFAELPEAARAGILAAIARRDRLRLAGLEFGPSFLRLLRTMWRVKLRMSVRARRGGRLARAGSAAVDVVCYSARKLPGRALTAARRRLLETIGRSGHGRSLATLLASAGLDESDLVVSFARGVPQEPRYRAYWDDRPRNRTVAKLIGVDLVPGRDGGFWFVESNVTPALVPERSRLYEQDPLVDGLIEPARDGGYRRLVYLDNSSDGVDPLLARRLAAGAAAAGLGLEIVNLPNVPQATYRRSYGIPDDEHGPGTGTLVINARAYPISLDRMLAFKAFTYEILGAYKAGHDEPDLRLPAWSRRPVVTAAGDRRPFPTLVYKLPGVDQGQGLAFVKARDQEHAMALAAEVADAIGSSTTKDRVAKLAVNRNGLWQAYVVPRFATGRRPYVVRAHVLLSARGVRLLSAHRVVSAVEVPDELPVGVVADPKPYVVNRSTGGAYAVVPPDEEVSVRRAAVAVGRGFAAAVERAFATRPR